MARPITWRNINVGSFDNASQMAVASNLLTGAFDSFRNVVTDAQDIQQKNFDNTTNQNDLSIAANIEQLNSLQALNNYVDNSGITALQKQYGVQYTKGKVQPLIDKQREILRNRAVDMAMGSARIAADEDYSVISGTQTFGDVLREQGAKENFILQKQAEFSKNAAPLQARYTETKKKNTQQVLSGITDIPKSNKEINELVMRAEAEFQGQGGIDAKKLSTELNRKLMGNLTDVERNYISDKRAREEKERIEVDKYSAKVMDAVRIGGIAAGQQVISTIPDAAVYTEVSNGVLQELKAQTHLLPMQKQELVAKDRAFTMQYTQLQEKYGRQQAALDTQVNNSMSLFPGAKKEVENINASGQPLVIKLSKIALNPFGLPGDGKKDLLPNKATLTAIHNMYNTILQDVGHEVDAQAILVLAMRDIAHEHGKKFWMGDYRSIVDKTLLTESAIKRVNQYKKRKEYISDSIQFSQDVEDDLQNKQAQYNEYTINTVKAYGDINLGRKPEAFTSHFSGTDAIEKYNTRQQAKQLAIDLANLEKLEKRLNENYQKANDP